MTMNTLMPVLIQVRPPAHAAHHPEALRWLLKLKLAVLTSTTPTPKARLAARGFQEPGINEKGRGASTRPRSGSRRCAS